MRTLKQILDSYSSGIQVDHRSMYAAVAAAYWAGKEEMRGTIVRHLESVRAGYAHTRYHRLERRAMMAMMANGLLGGQGRDDAAEIMAWDFDV